MNRTGLTYGMVAAAYRWWAEPLPLPPIEVPDPDPPPPITPAEESAARRPSVRPARHGQPWWTHYPTVKEDPPCPR